MDANADCSKRDCASSGDDMPRLWAFPAICDEMNFREAELRHGGMNEIVRCPGYRRVMRLRACKRNRCGG